MIYADEIMGLIKNLNRYNSGSDIEDYLSLWSHKQMDVTRKLSDPIHIENPFCCIVGTVQTSILGELFGIICFERKKANAFFLSFFPLCELFVLI
ncbi:hypothetical protein FACS1894199_04560 [Bacteroidia bacterium]|nr:hypothetical protein FACS1894199_04560 [Bacteroidia bacterium]